MPKVVWDEKALNKLNKFNLFISRRIMKSVDELKNNPLSKDIKKLTNSNYYRLRIGDYRVIFRVEKDNFIIVNVGHRKNIYKQIK